MNLTIILLIIGAVIILSIIIIVFYDKKNHEDCKISAGDQEKEDLQLSKSPNQILVDYNKYTMTPQEKVRYTLMAAIAMFLIGFIFYRSIIFALLLTPLAVIYTKYKAREIIKTRKLELTLQFKEGLYALSSSLTAGKSIEMAFREALKDLSILYPNPDTHIIREFMYIIRKTEMNETVEEALLSLAERAHLEEITSFADVFITCKRTGGNIIEVIKNTSQVLGEKIDFRNDINLLLAQRKFEQRVLNLIPIFLIALLSYMAADYMEPVFTTIIGKLVMTASIVLLAIAFFVSKKIMDIEV